MIDHRRPAATEARADDAQPLSIQELAAMGHQPSIDVMAELQRIFPQLIGQRHHGKQRRRKR
jgi:flagellar biosynthesis/type III secretory pathway ATPase